MSPAPSAHPSPEGPAGTSRPCPTCGYDRRGIPRDRPCPECGCTLEPEADFEVVTTPAVDMGLRCPKCSRPTPGQAIGSLCVHCAQSAPIDSPLDVPDGSELDAPSLCGQCGYDLRGTALTGVCPECGEPLAQPSSTFGPGGVPQRRTRRGELSARMPKRIVNSLLFRSGYGVLVTALIVLLITGLASLGGIDRVVYLQILEVIAVGVAASAWITLPRTLDIGRPWWAIWRWGARLALVCWPLGLAAQLRLWDWTLMQSQLLELIGLVGMAVYSAMLASVAAELDLRDTSRRLTTATWFVIPIGVFAHFGPYPGQVMSLGNTVIDGLIGSFILMTILPWIWLVIRLLRASWEIMRYGQWAVRATADARRRREDAVSRIKDADEGSEEAVIDWSPDRDIPL